MNVNGNGEKSEMPPASQLACKFPTDSDIFAPIKFSSKKKRGKLIPNDIFSSNCRRMSLFIRWHKFRYIFIILPLTFLFRLTFPFPCWNLDVIEYRACPAAILNI